MTIRTFTISIPVPEGIPTSEVEDHLRDAHRRACAGYHAGDPMRDCGEAVVNLAADSSKIAA